MSTKDGGDIPKPSAPEHQSLKAPDVDGARNASGDVVKATEATRTNASDGSLRDRAKLIAEQDDSIQIMGMGGRAASRTNRLSESELIGSDPKSKSIDIRELLAKPEPEAQALINEFGRVTNMPAGAARDAAFSQVQELADKTYGRGQFAEIKTPPDSSQDKITLKPVDSTQTVIKAGLDYNDVQVPLSQKLADFAKSAQARLLDPKGRQAYVQGMLDEITGVGEGLNIAKEEVKEATKTAATKAWTALCDGSVANFMATPNAINEPLFRTIGSCLDTMARDPNAVNNVLAVMGRELQSASDKYSKMSPHDRGVQDGKAMFFFINPEGSTEGGELALKAADRLATHVDKKVFEGITIAMQSADKLAQTAPELAAQSRQMVREYMQQMKLSSQELQHAGVPSRYVEELKPASDNVFMMKKKSHDFVKNLDGLDKVDDLRLKYDVSHKKNIAYADANVDGESSELIGISGKKPVGDTVGMPDESKLHPLSQGYDSRDDHSELKILEHIARKANEFSKGLVKIYTEREPCPSCEEVIKEFRRLYTGIVVLVEYGYNR